MTQAVYALHNTRTHRPSDSAYLHVISMLDKHRPSASAGHRPALVQAQHVLQAWPPCTHPSRGADQAQEARARGRQHMGGGEGQGPLG